MSSIREVAKIAAVSPATVSRVMNGITEQTVDCDHDFKAGLAMTKELLEKFPEKNGERFIFPTTLVVRETTKPKGPKR